MNEPADNSKPITPIPPDDLKRNLAIARPNTDQSLPHIGLVGDTYTILLSGHDTGGRYCLVDMHIPPGGGPPRHRHDFEESFIVTEHAECGRGFRSLSVSVNSVDSVRALLLRGSCAPYISRRFPLFSRKQKRLARRSRSSRRGEFRMIYCPERAGEFSPGLKPHRR